MYTFVLTLELAFSEKTDEKIYKLRIEVLWVLKVVYDAGYSLKLLFFIYWFFKMYFSRYKSKDRDATMSVLDIGLLTGFTVNTNDLDQVRALTNTHSH